MRASVPQRYWQLCHQKQEQARQCAVVPDFTVLTERRKKEEKYHTHHSAFLLYPLLTLYIRHIGNMVHTGSVFRWHRVGTAWHKQSTISLSLSIPSGNTGSK